MAAKASPHVNDVLRNDPQLRSIWHEFAEMPGLRLTVAQAQRLWTIDRATCSELLDRLVSAHLLVRGGDGRYRSR
jgi:DNA-binding IclR family transcriptional regulator